VLVLVSEFLLSVEVPMTAKKEKKEKKTKGSVSFAGSDEETKGDKGTTGGGDDHDSPAHFRPGAGYFLVLFSAWCS